MKHWREDIRQTDYTESFRIAGTVQRWQVGSGLSENKNEPVFSHIAHVSLFNFALFHGFPPLPTAFLSLEDCPGIFGCFLLIHSSLHSLYSSLLLFQNQLLSFRWCSLQPSGCCWSQAQSPCTMLYLAHDFRVFEGCLCCGDCQGWVPLWHCSEC